MRIVPNNCSLISLLIINLFLKEIKGVFYSDDDNDPALQEIVIEQRERDRKNKRQRSRLLNSKSSNNRITNFSSSSNSESDDFQTTSSRIELCSGEKTDVEYLTDGLSDYVSRKKDMDEDNTDDSASDTELLKFIRMKKQQLQKKPLDASPIHITRSAPIKYLASLEDIDKMNGFIRKSISGSEISNSRSKRRTKRPTRRSFIRSTSADLSSLYHRLNSAFLDIIDYPDFDKENLPVARQPNGLESPRKRKTNHRKKVLKTLKDNGKEPSGRPSSILLPFTDLQPLKSQPNTPAVGFIISDSEEQIIDNGTTIKDNTKTTESKPGRSLMINIGDINECEVVSPVTPVNSFKSDFATPTETAEITLDPHTIEDTTIKIVSNTGSEFIGPFLITTTAMTNDLVVDESADMSDTETSDHVAIEPIDTEQINTEPEQIDNEQVITEMLFETITSETSEPPSVFIPQESMSNDAEPSSSIINSSKNPVIIELPPETSNSINDEANMTVLSGTSTEIIIGGEGGFSIATTVSNDVTLVEDSGDEATSDDDSPSTSNTDEGNDDKVIVNTLVDNSDTKPDNMAIGILITPPISDPLSSLIPETNTAGISNEEEYDDEEYIEDPVEIERMRSTLKITQQILLVFAAVTFLSIFIYSIYYINLIRKIYARTRISV